MQLSPEAIKDFKTIYHTEYGIELSDAEAAEMARNLLSLFQVIASPLPGGAHKHSQSCRSTERASPRTEG